MMTLALLTSTSLPELEAMPRSRFDRYWRQVPYLLALVRSELASVAVLPHAGEKYSASFWAAIRDLFDTRTNKQKWAEGVKKLKARFGVGR
jgi:hypothetical protein